MRIVVDLSDARFDRAPSYRQSKSLRLTAALLRHRENREILVGLNGLTPNHVQPIRAALRGLLPPSHIRAWQALERGSSYGDHASWRVAAAKIIRSAFVANLDPDVVLIPRLSDESDDDSFDWTQGALGDAKRVLLIDSTPSPTGNRAGRETWRAADFVWALSPSSAAPLAEALNLPPERIRSSCAQDGESDIEAEAKELLRFLDDLVIERAHLLPARPQHRPKLAYVTPAANDGRHASSAEHALVNALAGHYDVDLIQPSVPNAAAPPWASGVFDQFNWFLDNAEAYDRVLYQIGRKAQDYEIIGLLNAVPGVVQIADLHLAQALAELENRGGVRGAVNAAIYRSHGYIALLAGGGAAHRTAARNYPASADVLQQAIGVIVRSEQTKSFGSTWYGTEFARPWSVIPPPLCAFSSLDREAARETLGFGDEEVVICCFNEIHPSRLHHRILEAFLASSPPKQGTARLIFLGPNHPGHFGAGLQRVIALSGQEGKIQITGSLTPDQRDSFLAAADIAIDLQSPPSIEPTSTADACRALGLPLITNARTDFEDFDHRSVYRLSESVSAVELVAAMERLCADEELRQTVRRRPQTLVQEDQSAEKFAQSLTTAIERAYAKAKFSDLSVARRIAALGGHEPSDEERRLLSRALRRSLPVPKPGRQLFVDVSLLARKDHMTGIQRVVRALVRELLIAPPLGFRIEPVLLSDEGGAWHFRYAREWTCKAMKLPDDWAKDEPIEWAAEDVLLTADLTGDYSVQSEKQGVYEALREDGVGVHFIVYDLLPIQVPKTVPPGDDTFLAWLAVVTRVADGVICISRTVADTVRAWMSIASPPRLEPLRIDWFHLGADISNSIPTKGIPDDFEKTTALLTEVPTFLMVGTLETRKGHLQAVEAFTRLWAKGIAVNLVLVGREAWKESPDSKRRTIPRLVKRIRNHRQLGKRLFWFDDASDELLERVYDASACLIAASEAEGFGLPLIEAAQRDLPIIARDIPVFKEVAGAHAYYFSGLSPDNLAYAVTEWLRLRRRQQIPLSSGMPWITWAESAKRISEIITEWSVLAADKVDAKHPA